MKIRSAIAAATIALVALGAGTANAATVYDAFNDFSLSNPSGQWSYGVGNAAHLSPLALLPTSGSNIMAAGLDYWQGNPQTYLVPIVIKNITAAPIATGTLLVPTNVLLIHPGLDSDYPTIGSDIVVQFKASAASTYSYSGLFELLDNNPSGVIGEVFHNSALLYSGALTGPAANLATFTPGQSEAFGGNVYLNAGDTLSFVVNNDGSVFNDSTGFNATITAVPEPATWAMLMFGFGLLGFMLRARKNSSALVA